MFKLSFERSDGKGRALTGTGPFACLGGVFQPIERVDQLPPPGPLSSLTREKHDLDFKARAEGGDTRAEHAKDIAAFANTMGGVIIVGAKEGNDSSVNYIGLQGGGLPPQTQDEVAKNLTEAGVDMCWPPVQIDCIPLTTPDGKKLVVVNIPPQPDFVTSPARGKSGGRYYPDEDGLRFPLRRHNKTVCLQASELGLFMHPHIRRIRVLLSYVPTPQDDTYIAVYHYGTPKGMSRVKANDRTIEDFAKLWGNSQQENAIEIGRAAAGDHSRCRIPFLEIADVWLKEDVKGSKPVWALKVDGYIDTQKWTYTPSHAPMRR